MPYSSSEGKDWIVERVVALKPRSVLDIGAGSGTYSDLLRPLLPRARFTAVEIFEPYVARFSLRAKYHEIRVGNALDILLPYADVVILGDVLEHLEHRDAVELWQQSRVAANEGVFLSLPVVEWPQGECEGNPFEAHLHTWSVRSVLDELVGVAEWSAGPRIGVFRGVPFGQLPATSAVAAA